jgi:fermentation-respiration switch protein FrsA (DUF1100 family)
MHQGSPLAVCASKRSSVIPRDGVRLSARTSLLTGQPPFPCVVFVHGLGSSKDSPRNTVIAQHLLDAGLATLLIDLSGAVGYHYEHVEAVGDDDVNFILGEPWGRRSAREQAGQTRPGA